MGFWITILGAIIIGVAFSFTSGGNGHGGAGNGGSKTPPRRKSDFRENEFDDEIEDFDRFFDDDL
ncbi:MAG: hypothetical protein J1D86_05490 [Alistipes sp.]|nr:hypothetical protein [Alistipes sp.]